MQKGYCTAKVRHFLGNDTNGKPTYDEWKELANNVPKIGRASCRERVYVLV